MLGYGRIKFYRLILIFIVCLTQPTDYNQLSIINYQLPITNYQLPIHLFKNQIQSFLRFL